MLELIQSVNSAVNNFIWGVPAMICIIGVGLYFNDQNEFLQIRKFPYAMKVTIGRVFKKEKLPTDHDTISGSMYGTSCDRRNRKYCRRGRSDRDRRSGCCFLDVDFSTSWNVYKVFRSNTCGTFQRKMQKAIWLEDLCTILKMVLKKHWHWLAYLFCFWCADSIRNWKCYTGKYHHNSN